MTSLSGFCLFVSREGEIAAGLMRPRSRFTAFVGPFPEGFPSASATGPVKQNSEELGAHFQSTRGAWTSAGAVRVPPSWFSQEKIGVAVLGCAFATTYMP